MATRFLFPYWSRFVGYFLVLADVPMYYIKNTYYDDAGITGSGFFTNGQTFFIVTILILILGMLLIAFSKERVEDEQISKLRLESLQWAIYLNYLILIICFLTYKGNNVAEVLHFNLKFPLLFFILRFRWVMFRLNRSAKEEAQPFTGN